MKVPLLLTLLLISTGCSFWKDPEPVFVDRVVYVKAPDPILPEPITLKEVEFKVLNLPETKETWFAVDTDNYEALADNVQELRRYFLDLQRIILHYRNWEIPENKESD